MELSENRDDRRNQERLGMAVQTDRSDGKDGGYKVNRWQSTKDLIFYTELLDIILRTQGHGSLQRIILFQCLSLQQFAVLFMDPLSVKATSF